ncbi:MAG TPA: hypothetical protein VLB68_18525 [Pyrinomonadaceae bacterium]|nr:hypothetical protein [Pyrinomonadaceae bacterium]
MTAYSIEDAEILITDAARELGRSYEVVEIIGRYLMPGNWTKTT